MPSSGRDTLWPMGQDGVDDGARDGRDEVASDGLTPGEAAGCLLDGCCLYTCLLDVITSCALLAGAGLFVTQMVRRA
jgi:hypothetical protein